MIHAPAQPINQMSATSSGAPIAATVTRMIANQRSQTR